MFTVLANANPQVGTVFCGDAPASDRMPLVPEGHRAGTQAHLIGSRDQRRRSSRAGQRQGAIADDRASAEGIAQDGVDAQSLDVGTGLHQSYRSAGAGVVFDLAVVGSSAIRVAQDEHLRGRATVIHDLPQDRARSTIEAIDREVEAVQVEDTRRRSAGPTVDDHIGRAWSGGNGRGRSQPGACRH